MSPRAWRALVLAAGVLAAVAATGGGRGVHAQGLQPPPEAPADGDWELEPADTLDDGALEVDLAATGARGESPRRARRVRFRGGGTDGALRDGDDPLAGGDLETPAAGGQLRIGRLAPRWGRGLLLGGGADPWSAGVDDRGERASYRGRAGDGATWRAGERAELLAGRFAKRSLLAARTTRGPWGAGLLGGGTHRPQASLAWTGDGPLVEVAGDRRGRWRAEFAHEQPLGERTSLAVRARGGHAEFRSLAEPVRAGPARAVAASVQTFAGECRAVFSGALWRFAPGAAGARAALVFDVPLSEHAAVDAGFEEQRGPRRETDRAGALRQGFWSEWRADRREVAVAVRHELWGERSFARAAVRRALAVRARCALPAGAALTVSHWAWSARSGESLWLPEAEGNRLALRALRGEGERTRVECVAPVPGGRARLALTLARPAGRPSDVRWTVEWSRRGRL